MTDLPIACTLDPEALRSRRQGLLAELARRARHRSALEEGCQFTFEATDETLALIATVVNAERRCCSFLRFSITVEPGGGPIVLDLTGPPGTADFLSDLLATDGHG